jgi:hypothetical protein
VTRPPVPEGPEGEERLTDEEIEAILAREGQLPAEAPPDDAPVKLVQNEPGQGRFGKWVVWVLIGFILVTAFSVIGR